MHTLQRDMTVPPFSFSIQVAQHYIQPRRRLCLFFGKSTLPFFFCFFFFWPFFPSIPLSSSYYQHFFFLLFYFFYFRGVLVFTKNEEIPLIHPSISCPPMLSFFFFLWCSPTLLHGLSVLMDPTWLLSHTHTHTTKQHRKKSTHGTTTLAIFFFAGEGGGVIYVDLIWIIYTERVSGAHIISICVLALLRYP